MAIRSLNFDVSDPSLHSSFRQQAEELKKALVKELFFLNLEARKAQRR